MNDSEYTQGVFSVKSDAFAPNNADPFEFVQALRQFIDAAQKLDKAKKALFYPGAPSFGHSRYPIEHFNFGVFKDNEAVDLFHGLLGLLTESGELAERLILLAKMDWNNTDQIKESTTNLVEEFGDIFWYLYLSIADIGETPAYIRDRNIRKLRTRYPEKFSGGSALRRNVEAELRALSPDPKDARGK